MKSTVTTGCVIMASGIGKRFGSNKLLADFGGKTLIERCIEKTNDLFDYRMVVTRSETVKKMCDLSGIPVILHSLPDKSDTIKLGLSELASKTDICAFMPADQPLLHRDTLASLLEKARYYPDKIWRTSYEKSPASPVIFPKTFYDELLNLPEGCGGSYVINNHPDCVSLLPVANEYELQDVDRPEDLEYLLNIWNNKQELPDKV